jgi:arsenite methyltransferase
VATQVYEYIADLPRALSEVRRVLRERGRLLILDTDWDSIVLNCRDRELMKRVLAAWDQHLVHPDLPRRLAGLLEDASFSIRVLEVVPLLNVGYDRNSYSAGLIETIGAFVAGRDGLTEADVRAWADDLSALGRDYFFSLNRYLFLAVR